MDRNLGAESSDINSGLAGGLHYQWGRKDPIPSFATMNTDIIYLESKGQQVFWPYLSFKGETINYIDLNGKNYEYDYTDSYEVYGSSNPLRSKKISENIQYSIQNPLRFLYHKGTGAIYDGGNHYGNDLKKVRDWVSDERGAADNRWGHADKKSPFDPCPEGWRVPDVSLTHLYIGSKGNSPWFNSYSNDAYGKPGVIQDQWHDIANFYKGSSAGNNGWKFEDVSFAIGQFPKDGIRGELGGNKVTLERTGVWTAAMADMNTGFALAMQFEGNKMQSGTGVYPQAGMNVRCAKDEKRLLGTPVERSSQTLTTQQPQTVIQQPENRDLQVYPNPFKDEFYVANPDAVGFEIYDFSGKLILSGKINNQKVSAGKMQNGIYLIKISMKDGSALTKKMIKQ